MRTRSSWTFSSRLSARSPWTSDSAGFFCSVDIAAQSRLELAQAEVLHLAAQITRFDREALDALESIVREPIELARVDEHAQRELFAVLFDDVLVAGHGAAGDLGLSGTAATSRPHIDRAAHVRNPSAASSEATVVPVAAGAPGQSDAGPRPHARLGAAPRRSSSACRRPAAGRRDLDTPARNGARAPANAWSARP